MGDSFIHTPNLINFMKFAITGLLFLTAITFAHSQTATEIIEKYRIATGGAALDSLRTAKMKGTVYPEQAPTMVTDIVVSILDMKAYRMDIHVPEKYDAVLCVYENTGWDLMKFGDTSMVTNLDQKRMEELKPQTELLGPLHHYEAKNYPIEYLGIEAVNGRDAYKIQVKAANNTTYICFIDSRTFLEVKQQIEAPIGGIQRNIELTFSDIRPVSGVMMPFRIDMKNRKGVTVFQYSDIQLNAALGEELFKKP
jgi:hypothetical protein